MPQTETLKFGERRPGDPAPAFLFEVRGGIQGGFSEVTGLQQEVEVVEYHDPISPLEVRNAVGPLKSGRVTLRKGLVRAIEVFQWFRDVTLASQRAATDQYGQAKPVLGSNEYLVRRSVALPEYYMGITETEDRRFGVTDNHVLDAAQDLGLFRDVEVIVYDHRQARVGPKPDGTASTEGGRGGGIYSVKHVLLRGCFPVTYDISDLSGLSTKVAIESITLAFNSMEVDIGTAPPGAAGPAEIETQSLGQTGSGPFYGSTEGPVLSGPF